ncbi:hypothetical protein AMATHDRAFT_69539 [Amanita thiersii Skay4041]|uniref:MYND-type domain-containing protein n=1 Tax=Amanita thiersii Skay4041 TaxID=703135 RepID=A0A2A9N7S0_9AGAR|nr:hypothetical protein AMATHDRAFT_69539 [Amanita thiersii Skay4041]
MQREVTTNSLARCAGLEEANEDIPDTDRYRALILELYHLQSAPKEHQDSVFCEIAASYLPQLVNKYRISEGPVNIAMTFLNNVTNTPYFVRFSRLPEAQGLVDLQARRIIEAPDNGENFNYDELGAACQFLLTLIVYEGGRDFTDQDRQLLIHKANSWHDLFRGTGLHIEESCDLLVKYLEHDERTIMITKLIKRAQDSKLLQCGFPGCEQLQEKDGPIFKQCPRCKSTVYCNDDHQAQAWAGHKHLCFEPVF